MSKKNVYEILNNIDRKNYENLNFTTYDDIVDEIEGHVQSFLKSKESAIQKYILNAKLEGWLGSDEVKKCSRGLLGYLRTGFGVQIKILKNLKVSLPLGQSEFVGFFRSDWFRKTTLDNGSVRTIYKKEHIELLKKYPNYL